MLEQVALGQKRIKDYRGIITDELYEEIIALAKEFKGLKVLHLNATSYGGGVADILQSFVPLLSDLGLAAEWQVIAGTEEFFNITKFLHNSFQNGRKFALTKKQRNLYQKINFDNAGRFENYFDLVMVHDPQPAALPYYLEESETRFVWRLHIDTSNCADSNWNYFAPFLAKYQACIFTSPEYASKTIPIKDKFYIAPAIDPLHPKNQPIPASTGLAALESHGIDIRKPIMTQVSRFDPWKDPIGVIRAYRLAKKEIKDLQLVLAASMANDDPEGWKMFKEIKKFAGRDKNVFLIINTTEKNDLMVNSLQRHSDVVVQKSTKEGFGLVVTEAMWKGKPVVGGDTVGIRMQIENGKTGFLVKNFEECAEKVVFLLKSPKKSHEMGEKAVESVRHKFLLPRLIRDELVVYRSVLSAKTAAKVSLQK